METVLLCICWEVWQDESYLPWHTKDLFIHSIVSARSSLWWPHRSVCVRLRAVGSCSAGRDVNTACCPRVWTRDHLFCTASQRTTCSTSFCCTDTPTVSAHKGREGNGEMGLCVCVWRDYVTDFLVCSVSTEHNICAETTMGSEAWAQVHIHPFPTWFQYEVCML